MCCSLVALGENVDGSWLTVGEVAVGDARLLAPGLAEGVAEDEPLPLPGRRPSCRERLRITSDFIEDGRRSPWSFKLGYG